MNLDLLSTVLAPRGQAGARYAYATYTPNGWLMRAHVTAAGRVLFDYATPILVFETSKIEWQKYGALKPHNQTSDQIRLLDFSFEIPAEWVKPADIVWPQDRNRECRNCANAISPGNKFCTAHNTYTSPLMSCPQFTNQPCAAV